MGYEETAEIALNLLCGQHTASQLRTNTKRETERRPRTNLDLDGEHAYPFQPMRASEGSEAEISIRRQMIAIRSLEQWASLQLILTQTYEARSQETAGDGWIVFGVGPARLLSPGTVCKLVVSLAKRYELGD